MRSESLGQQSTSGMEEKELQTGKQGEGLLHSPCERRGDLVGTGTRGQAAAGRTWRVIFSLLEVVMG